MRSSNCRPKLGNHGWTLREGVMINHPNFSPKFKFNFSETEARLRFRSGNSKRGAGTIHQTEAINLHPDYQEVGGIAVNDIAVVRISPAFDFSETTQSINITDKEPAAGDNATISGWGVTSVSSAHNLLFLHLKFLSGNQLDPS